MELDFPDDKGTTLRDHLEQVTGAGVIDPRLEEWANFPSYLLYLWDYFMSLHLGRGATGFGPAPLTYAGIYAWGQLSGGVDLSPWELTTLLAMDAKFVQKMADRMSKYG